MAIARGGWRGRRRAIRGSRRAGLAAALIVVAGIASTPAAGAESERHQKLPRFVSLRSDEVNLRVGPGQTYPIEWVLTRKGMPVEIVKEFQNWRRVQIWQNGSGWILDRMVTAERHVIVDGAVRILYRQPDAGSGIVARAEPGVVAKLLECRDDWCQIETGGYRGWLQRGDLWGVLPGETVP